MSGRNSSPQARPDSSTREVLAGLVERVTFHNAENGFCVLRVKARGHRELITVIGHAAVIAAGEWVTASGEWVNDRTHGQQFKSRFMRTSAPTIDRGHREVSRFRDDPRHRPGLRPEDGQGVRREGVRCDRGRARSPARGDRHRARARQAHHRRLGRAEDRAGDHGLPAQPRRGHRSRGPHLQDLRRRCRPGHDREPLSTRARHPRHRLQDRRCDRHEARHREDGDDPRARRDLLRADRGDGRGSLRIAHRGTDAVGRRVARSTRGPDSDRAGSRTGRENGNRRYGRRDGLHLSRRPLPSRAGHRRADTAPGQWKTALALHRPGEGAAVDRAEDRLVVGRKSGRRDPARPLVEGARHHRRARCGQDDHRQLDPAHPGRQGRQPVAVRPDGPRRQAHDRGHRVRGQDHPPAARGGPQRPAASNEAATTRSTATCWSSTRPPWSTLC